MHGHTRLEMIWTVIPVVILCDHRRRRLPRAAGNHPTRPPRRTRSQITVEGHQFYWQFDYPNGARTINDLHVPVGRSRRAQSRTRTTSSTAGGSRQLGGKIQAIPGRTNHMWFKADRAGTYYGQCAELCGIYHASMTRASSRRRRRSTRATSKHRGREGPRQAPSSGRLRDVPRRCRARAATARTSRTTRCSRRRPGWRRSSATAAARCRRSVTRGRRRSSKALVAYVKAHVYKGAAEWRLGRKRSIRSTWKSGRVARWLVTVDHKRIGIMYIATSLFFFARRRHPRRCSCARSSRRRTSTS